MGVPVSFRSYKADLNKRRPLNHAHPLINSFQVNDESVENMSTAQIIDLLRIIRGAICLTILRKDDASDDNDNGNGQEKKAEAVG